LADTQNFFLCYLLWDASITVPNNTVHKKLIQKEFALLSLSGIAYFVFNYPTFMTYTLGAEVGRVDAINNSQVFVEVVS
jgi:hypothetical protein